MSRMLLLLSIAASILVVGCGGSATVQPSVSTMHSSPSPTPTVLSQRQQLVVYLQEFSKYDKRETAVANSDSRIYKVASGMYQGDNFSALRARMLKNAQKWNDLSVDYGALDPPQCVAASDRLYVRFLRNAYLSDLAYCDYLATSAKDGSDFGRFKKLANLADNEFMSWSFSLRVTARKLHVHIPFPIKET